MRFLACLCILTGLAGCAATTPNFVDDRPPVGVQGPRPVCSSGPGGKTAACVSAMVENAAIQSRK